MDPHWRPITTNCHTCSIDYDYILRFESLDKEEPLFKMLMQFEVFLEKRSKNVNRPDDYTEDKLTELYFEQLSDEEIAQLYRTYEADFKLFNYQFSYRNVVYTS